jgi:hypothetical protein
VLGIGDVDFDTAGTDDYEFRFAGIDDPGQLVKLMASIEHEAPAPPVRHGL